MKHAPMALRFCVCGLLLFGSQAQAQFWCPPGSQWWHTYNDGSGTLGYVLSIYDGDTVINDMTWSRVSANVHAWNIPSQFAYEEEFAPLHFLTTSDAVLILHEDVQDTLYDFGALPGEFWNAPEWIPEVRYVVTDTGSWIVNAIPLRWLAVDVLIGAGQSQLVLTDTLVERFGFLHQYMDLSFSLSLNPYITELRCYTDNEVTYSTEVSPTCDFTVAVVDLSHESAEFFVFPNPGVDHIWLSQRPRAGASRICVWDVRGMLVLDRAISQADSAIDMRGLHPGCYTIQYTANNGRANRAKWIKQE